MGRNDRYLDEFGQLRQGTDKMERERMLADSVAEYVGVQRQEIREALSLLEKAHGRPVVHAEALATLGSILGRARAFNDLLRSFSSTLETTLEVAAQTAMAAPAEPVENEPPNARPSHAFEG